VGLTTDRQGTQGILDGASNGSLDSEFGTHKEEEVVKIILEKGTVQETETSERVGNRNLTQGSFVAH
jgi:ribosome maturation protein Sdo1